MLLLYGLQKHVSECLQLLGSSPFVACVYSLTQYSMRVFYLLSPQDSSQIKQVPSQGSSCLAGGWSSGSGITVGLGAVPSVPCVWFPWASGEYLWKHGRCDPRAKQASVINTSVF